MKNSRNPASDFDVHRAETVPSEAIPELRFLEGPQSRFFELGRVLRIAGEFVRGFRRLHFAGPCVTVFGSARFPEEHRYYELARETSGLLAKEGFTIMTGGGPGIMEAANRGRRRPEAGRSPRPSSFPMNSRRIRIWISRSRSTTSSFER